MPMEGKMIVFLTYCIAGAADLCVPCSLPKNCIVCASGVVFC